MIAPPGLNRVKEEENLTNGDIEKFYDEEDLGFILL
jgi:hypothetical protein